METVWGIGKIGLGRVNPISLFSFDILLGSIWFVFLLFVQGVRENIVQGQGALVEVNNSDIDRFYWSVGAYQQN